MIGSSVVCLRKLPPPPPPQGSEIPMCIYISLSYKDVTDSPSSSSSSSSSSTDKLIHNITPEGFIDHSWLPPL